MSDLSIEPQSIEKLYTFTLKDTSFESTLLDLLNMLPRLNLDGKLNIFIISFKFIDFSFTNK